MPRKKNNKSKENSEENLDNESNHIKPRNDDIADEDYDTTDESEDDLALLLTEKEKPFTYSDLVRETLLKEGSEAFEDDEELPEKGLSYNEEQNELKKAFLEASKEIDDDEFFTKSDAVDEIPDFKPSQVQNKAVRENELISRYWSSEEKLDENEEFLRDYILNQRWREDRLENFKVDHTLDKIDEYDEEHMDKADEYECKYNFRFEEQDGAKIIGYPRNIEDSVRKPDERRRNKRLEKRQRKKEEKIRRDEEIKRLKNLRKTSYEKMEEIASTAGVVVKHDAIDLDAPFDPEQHERDMKKIIGLGYDKDDVDDVEEGSEYEEDDDPEVWWMCDSCKKGIPAGELHFDCKECENYTLCQKCFNNNINNTSSNNYNKYKNNTNGIENNNNNDTNNTSNNTTGSSKISNKHDHNNFSSRKVPLVCGPPEEMEESFDLDYEDYIADMPVKFKYRKVDPVPCDLDMILEKSDKELNQMMPLRKLIGYDIPNQNINNDKYKNKNNTNGMENNHKFSSLKKKKKYLKSMTSYNVNRDRLSAFGLHKKKVKHRE